MSSVHAGRLLLAATVLATASFAAGTAAAQNLSLVERTGGGHTIAAVEVVSRWERLIPSARTAITVQPGDDYDIARMRTTLQNLYALGTVANVRVEASAAAGGLLLRFVLEPQVHLWDVHFTGERPWSKGRLRAALSVREGDALDAEALGNQETRLQQALADDGYLLAAVSGKIVEGDTPARGILELHITPGAQARLADVSITTDGGIAGSELAIALALPAGSPYRPIVFEEALDRVRARLLQSNFFFHETRVVEQSLDLSDNSMWLEVEVAVGPRVDLDFSGQPFSEEILRQRLAVFEFGTVDDWALKDSRHELVRWLQERGHWRPLVSYSRDRDEQGRNTSVRFRVLAGRTAKLVRIEFTGTDRVAASTLAATIRSQPAGFLAPRRFISDWWLEDQRAVTTSYRRRGFSEASVVNARARYDEQAGGVVATMSVQEGPISRVRSVDVTLLGSDAPSSIDSSLWATALQLYPGGPFDPGAVRRDADLLRALLASVGYPRAIVTSDAERDDEGVAITHTVVPGVLQRVGKVLIAGNDATRDNVIERELAFASGAPFSFADLLETQSRLYATGLFSQVDVAPAVSDDLEVTQPLVVRVQEAPPMFITYGAGFDTEEKVRGTFTIGHNNIAGRNQELSFSTRASVREQRFRVLFREPYFLGRRTEGTATAFYTNEQEASFKVQRYGVSFQLLVQHSDRVASLPRLVFRDTSTFDVEINPRLIRPEDQSTRVGALTYSLIVDTRPNPINPTSGFYGTTDVELATRMLGSNTNFVTVLGRWFGYRRLTDRLTLALGARAGIKIPHSGSDSIPLPERFFAGGSTTLRGFQLDGAGPVDDSGNPLGGRVLLISNIELRAQLWGELGGVAFADFGNVFAQAGTITWREVRETVGIGIRYSTPVGPIRFDFARLMDRRVGEDRYQVFFSIGHTF